MVADDHVTVKGGVVMQQISGDRRRATRDIDLDFVRHPMTDEGIRGFIRALFPQDADVKLEVVGPIEELKHQVLPEDKASYVSELESQGHRVIMVGDGINDSPALAAASVSVALADASDIARTVADVSIRSNSLERLVYARVLSQRLQRRIESRYLFIVGFNTMLIVLGVTSLIPLTTAATLHNLSTVAIAASNTRPLMRQRRRARDAVGGL